MTGKEGANDEIMIICAGHTGFHVFQRTFGVRQSKSFRNMRIQFCREISQNQTGGSNILLKNPSSSVSNLASSKIMSSLGSTRVCYMSTITSQHKWGRFSHDEPPLFETSNVAANGASICSTFVAYIDPNGMEGG